MNSLFTRFAALDTSSIPSREAKAKYKPDVIIYDKRKEFSARTALFQTMEMFVEFKRGNSSDPFGTDGNFFPKLFKTASSTRGQIILYSTRQRAYQFRTSILTVGIFGKVARLMRLDNTGFKVTVPIDYSKEEGNCQLVEFFLRLDQMADDPEARGWDPTVRDATPVEVGYFSEAVEAVYEAPYAQQQTRTRGQKKKAQETADPLLHRLIESVGKPEEYLRKKVSVLEQDVERDYIVGRPTSILKAPTGRTTRGFVAMSMQTKKLVFLKDSWRPESDSFQPEDHWYGILKEYEGIGMKSIGTYLHGSDVYATREFVKCEDKKQRTITHLYAKDLGRKEEMVGYIHHRIVLSELYLPLEMFRDSKHLTEVMYDIANGAFL